MRENATTKAHRYLTEGRLIVTTVVGNQATATCRGDGAIYQLEVHGDTATCTCPAKGRCAHLIALGHVTATNRTPQ